MVCWRRINATLHAMRPHIDSWLVLDTGSNDTTVAQVTQQTPRIWVACSRELHRDATCRFQGWLRSKVGFMVMELVEDVSLWSSNDQMTPRYGAPPHDAEQGCERDSLLGQRGITVIVSHR